MLILAHELDFGNDIKYISVSYNIDLILTRELKNIYKILIIHKISTFYRR